MRVLALLAPLLLSGCVLLTPVVQAPGMPSRPTDGFEHDGYLLACEGVEVAACAEEADRIVAELGLGREVSWVVVRPDGHDVCWHGLLEATCEGVLRPASRRSSESAPS